MDTPFSYKAWWVFLCIFTTPFYFINFFFFFLEGVNFWWKMSKNVYFFIFAKSAEDLLQHEQAVSKALTDSR